MRISTASAWLLCTVGALGLGWSAWLEARQFRALNPIAAPHPAAALPAGATPVAEVVAVPRADVERALERVVKAWNSQQLEQHLAPAFYDRSRLLDALDTSAPRDATLRLQSVQGVQTLEQYTRPDPAHPGDEQLVSRVSVTARTQVEFRGSDGTFTRRDGVNEFILRITHAEAPP